MVLLVRFYCFYNSLSPASFNFCKIHGSLNCEVPLYTVLYILDVPEEHLFVCWCLQVFHALLDLPCVTAAQELCHASMLYSTSDLSILPPSIALYQDPRHRPLFSFILRNQGGFGDTIDRWIPQQNHSLKELFTICYVSPLLNNFVPMLLDTRPASLHCRMKLDNSHQVLCDLHLFTMHLWDVNGLLQM